MQDKACIQVTQPVTFAWPALRSQTAILCVLHVDVTCLSYLHVAGILNSAYSSSPMEAGRMRIQRPSESNDQAMM